MIMIKGKTHLEHRQYTFGAGHSVAGIIMRELDGDDELEAARMAATRKSLDEEETMRHLLYEQLRLAVVAVRRSARGKWEEVQQPFEEMDRWKQKSRNLVSEAFQKMNMLSKKEVEDFLEGSLVATTSGAAPVLEDEVVEEVA